MVGRDRASSQVQTPSYPNVRHHDQRVDAFLVVPQPSSLIERVGDRAGRSIGADSHRCRSVRAARPRDPATGNLRGWLRAWAFGSSPKPRAEKVLLIFACQHFKFARRAHQAAPSIPISARWDILGPSRSAPPREGPFSLGLRWTKSATPLFMRASRFRFAAPHCLCGVPDRGDPEGGSANSSSSRVAPYLPLDRRRVLNLPGPGREPCGQLARACAAIFPRGDDSSGNSLVKAPEIHLAGRK